MDERETDQAKRVGTNNENACTDEVVLKKPLNSLPSLVPPLVPPSLASRVVLV